MARPRTPAEIRLLGRERHRKAGVPSPPPPARPSPPGRLRLRPDVSPSATVRCLSLPPRLLDELDAAGVTSLGELSSALARDGVGWALSERDESTVRRSFSWYLVPETEGVGR